MLLRAAGCCTADRAREGAEACDRRQQYGNEDLFAAKIAEACVLAMPENETNFNTDNVRVAKIVGNSVHATTVVQGMCLTRGVLGTITDARGQDRRLRHPADHMTETKVLLKSAAEAQGLLQLREESLEAVIKAIADAGTKMIICGQVGDSRSTSSRSTA